MVDRDRFDEFADEFMRLWLEATMRRLEQARELCQPWFNRMLNEPIPDDWQAELDRFIGELRESTGWVVLPHSVRNIEALIRSRLDGTGPFAVLGPAAREQSRRGAQLKLPHGHRPAPPTNTRTKVLLVSERKPKKADPSQGALEGETQFPLYKNPKTGETYEKVIDATGTRRDDKLAADLAAGIEREKLPEAVTWHHAGFDPSTGKMKMQLVQRPPHAAEGHTGGFAEFLDWAAETLNSGNLKNLTAAQARALANALHSGDTMRQLGPRLSKLGIETAYEGATLVIKKGKSIIARTLTREVAGKTIRMIMKAGAVLFVISAAAEAKAAGADDWQVVQAAMREMVSADVWEAGFSFTVVAGAEVVSNAVSPPPATARAQRQRLSQLSAAQRREEVRKLRATFNFVQTEQWARMNGSLQKSLDAMKKTWDTISSGKAQK